MYKLIVSTTCEIFEHPERSKLEAIAEQDGKVAYKRKERYNAELFDETGKLIAFWAI